MAWEPNGPERDDYLEMIEDQRAAELPPPRTATMTPAEYEELGDHLEQCDGCPACEAWT